MFISDLFNCNGEIYNDQQFRAISGIESTCRDYHMVVKNISIKLLQLVKRISVTIQCCGRQTCYWRCSYFGYEV